MKPAIASLALAIVFCGPTLVRRTFLAFAAPGQRPPSSMMDSPPEGPPGMIPGTEGKWWRDPELTQKLHVSEEQVQKIEKIAQDHQIQDIDLRADLKKQDAILRSQMEKDLPDEAQVLAQMDKVNQARVNLEKSHVQMMLAIRRVLTAEQAQKLRDLRPMHVPPAPGFGPPDQRPGRPPGEPPEPSPGGEAN